MRTVERLAKRRRNGGRASCCSRLGSKWETLRERQICCPFLTKSTAIRTPEQVVVVHLGPGTYCGCSRDAKFKNSYGAFLWASSPSTTHTLLSRYTSLCECMLRVGVAPFLLVPSRVTVPPNALSFASVLPLCLDLSSGSIDCVNMYGYNFLYWCLAFYSTFFPQCRKCCCNNKTRSCLV